MTTLDDKLLGFKRQNYVSSSSEDGSGDEGDCSEKETRDDEIERGPISEPFDFRLEVPKV